MRSELPELKPRQARIYTYTDKAGGSFMGNTRETAVGMFYGWTVNGKSILSDWNIYCGGKLLDRRAAECGFRADRLIRVYPGGITETVCLLDWLNVLCVDVAAPPAAKAGGFSVFTGGESIEADAAAAGAFFRLAAGGAGAVFKTETGLRLVAGAGDCARADRLRRVNAEYSVLLENRRRRMLELTGQFAVSDSRLNDALDWARLSLDSLIVNEGGMRGIWAGLPWFNQFWGRDTFISLPGAALCDGGFDTARAIIESFARAQNTNEADILCGRMPNRIAGGAAIYNSADAAKWFVLACYKHLLYSGDAGLAAAVYPAVARELDCAAKLRMGPDFFIRHGDAETWMDAVGPAGPYTPRGDRAVEIQALWHYALKSGAAMAELLGKAGDAARWTGLAASVKASFNAFYVRSDGFIYDHLNPDGSPDAQDRPNRLLAFSLPEMTGFAPLIKAQAARAEIRRIAAGLVKPHGVLSLAENDGNFHRYHDYPSYAHKDEAYHNGTAWTWLAGPFITAAAGCGPEPNVLRLFAEEARQIGELDALGGLSELLEACPRPGETFPRISGAVNQAWSLAEFLRNFTEDLWGYKPCAPQNRFRLAPILPELAGEAEARLPYKDGRVSAFITRKKGKKLLNIEFQASGEAEAVLGPAGNSVKLGAANRGFETKI